MNNVPHNAATGQQGLVPPDLSDNFWQLKLRKNLCVFVLPGGWQVKVQANRLVIGIACDIFCVVMAPPVRLLPKVKAERMSSVARGAASGFIQNVRDAQ